MLNRITFGADTLPPLLMAHGLWGQARNWTWHAKTLSDIRRIIAVDMRNHGDSPWFDSHSYAEMGDDLAKELEQPTDVLGHFMGGKAAMAMALGHPDKLRRLIVADIAPVPYRDGQSHIVAAMRSLDLAQITRRGEAADALVAAGLPQSVAGFLTQSIDLKTKSWKFNLDVLAQEMPQILDFPKFQTPFEGETLFLVGADSDYVQPENRAEMRRLFPNHRLAKIPGAGHWLHADQPAHVEAAIRAFLTA